MCASMSTKKHAEKQVADRGRHFLTEGNRRNGGDILNGKPLALWQFSAQDDWLRDRTAFCVDVQVI